MRNIRREHSKHCFLLRQVQAANADACIRQVLEKITAGSNICRIQLNAELCQIAEVSNAARAAFIDSNLAAIAAATALVGNQCAGSIAEGGFNIQRNIAAHSDFYSTRMDNLRAVMRHLANLGIGNLVEDISTLNNTRISSHNAFNVSVNLYEISLERCAQSSSRGIAAATAKRRELIIIFRHALEAADNRNNAGFQQTHEIRDIDIFDACSTKLGISNNASLTTGQGHSIDAKFLQRCCHNAGGNDFAAAHHHIHLAHINRKIDILQSANQRIRSIGCALAAHCGHNDNRRITIADRLLYFIFYGNASFL